MFKLLLKIFSTPKSLIKTDSLLSEQKEIITLGGQIQEKVRKLFNGSLAIRQVDAGSDNACEQELVALGNAFYDVERFGIHFVASPKHADMLMVTGPVTRNMADALKRAYEATPNPKIIVAVGDSAIDGGIYKGTYASLDGVHNVIPVDYQIPGDPPSPKMIINGLLNILTARDNNNSK